MTETTHSKDLYKARLGNLRQEMAKRDLDAWLVPMTDPFQNEYIPASDRRVAFLSGFTGSAGFIVVLMDKAAFFTDGRYTLQAARQVPGTLFQLFDTADTLPGLWLRDQARLGFKIGFDPRLHTADGIDRLTKTLGQTGAEIMPTTPNLVDMVWPDRPEAPAEPIVPYALTYAGVPSADKRAACAKTLGDENDIATILTDPASIAWLLNIRGGDVPHAPLPLSYAILKADGSAALFADPRKIDASLATHLGPDVQIADLVDFVPALRTLGAQRVRVRVNTAETPYCFVEALRESGAQIDKGRDPTALPRACKNPTELEGMRAAHLRDGVALTRFLAWLDRQPPQTVTELSAEAQLESYRAAQDLYKGPSFDTIAGYAANGAIVHYRATEETNATLGTDSLFLLDSGCQYLDGTTDVTRTVVLGKPTEAMRRAFTLVLKGHIALSRIRFPEGITGAELDVLARQFLWNQGLDYAHGTGHGVGSYLVVHEGPQAISRRSPEPLKPGMVLSNEPGYYETGAFGIRHENLMAVVKINGVGKENHAFLGFEPLTLAPFDRRGLDRPLLCPAEVHWINTYHANVKTKLTPYLSQDDADWLSAACAPL